MTGLLTSGHVRLREMHRISTHDDTTPPGPETALPIRRRVVTNYATIRMVDLVGISSKVVVTKTRTPQSESNI
jgi:hypothetical protein